MQGPVDQSSVYDEIKALLERPSVTKVVVVYDGVGREKADHFSKINEPVEEHDDA